MVEGWLNIDVRDPRFNLQYFRKRRGRGRGRGGGRGKRKKKGRKELRTS